MGVPRRSDEIPPDLFEQVVAGGEPKRPMSRGTRLTKAWHDFTSFFGQRGHRSVLRLLATSFTPQSSQTLDEFCEGDHEYYVGFSSPH